MLGCLLHFFVVIVVCITYFFLFFSDGPASHTEDDFLTRLTETGATECSDDVAPTLNQDDPQAAQLTIKNILQNILSSFNHVWHVNEVCAAAALATLPEDEPSRTLLKAAKDLEVEIRKFLMSVSDLHLEHRPLADNVQNHRDVDFKSKAECKRLAAHTCLTRFVLTFSLQVEKDSFSWHEKEVNLKVELADIAQRVSLFSESRIAELEQILQKLANERVLLETKFEEATREPSRKEIIQEFKAVENEIKSLSGNSAHQLSEIKKLHSVVRSYMLQLRDLREYNQESLLFLEMYRRESTDSSDVIESKDNEYKTWALVQSLKSSLDEHNLELRVKAAIEAEATSQKRLTSVEAEIDELRRKLEACGRYLMLILSFILPDLDMYLLQLKVCSDQVGKLAEDGWQSTVMYENTKKRLLEVQTESDKLRQSFVGMQNKVEKSRLDVTNMLIELEKERYQATLFLLL
ncbi:hypothetical protein BHE74_00013277 [Ensete ventricosum]|nr:hypothetical protein BHE74_00013277 [Ensete ventricosum]RZR88548.1 hypothetical protein BHM03_00016149 [Ensete ventricosum]